MTRQSDRIVAVKVTIRLDPSSTLVEQLGGRRFVCCAAQDGTLADLRVVLVQDKAIDDNDGCFFVLDGRVIGRASESHIKWCSLVKNEEIVLSRMPTSLFRKSKLGKGIIISGDNGPQYAGHAVIADGDSVAASLLDTQETFDETIHSYSMIAAEFARAGWSKSAIASVSSSMSDDSRTLPHTKMWITGRHLHSACQLTLPSPHALQPHRELKTAVEKALEEQDITKRRQKLDKVWERYGTFYIDSVEMGGMYHATRMLDVSQKDTGEVDMRDLLSEQFTNETKSCTEGATAEKQPGIPADHSKLFRRVGGGQDADYSQWIASLAQPVNWSTTRILQVTPVIELFDDDVQAKITLSSGPLACDRKSSLTTLETASAFGDLAKDFRWEPTADNNDDNEYGFATRPYPPSTPGSTELSDEDTQAELDSSAFHVVAADDKGTKNTIVGPPYSSSTTSFNAFVPEATSSPTAAAVTTGNCVSGTQSTILVGDPPDTVERETVTLLSQLTAARFDSISDDIIAYATKSENEAGAHTLKQISRAVFERAVNETESSRILARLCRKMRERISPKVQADEIRTEDGRPIVGGDLFREYLLNCCQQEFGRSWASKETTACQDRSAKIPANNAECHTAGKARRLGIVKLIGELFRVQILAELIVHKCILKFLSKADHPEEEKIEGLCLLLTTAGDLLDTLKAQAHMNAYFSRMKQFASDLAISSHIRSMLLDVIGLRERNWASRQSHSAY